jgi:valyl-tRNA synthetase
MIMMNCHFMRGNPKGDKPFSTVYIHALVRDAEGQKMSKTKGNVMDPIGVIEKYGTDAVRFTLAAMAAPGTDIAFSESRTESYRAFANKIWNAARFLFMNVDKAQESGLWSLEEFKKTQKSNGNQPGAASSSPAVGREGGSSGKGIAGFHSETLEDRWILSRFNRVAQEIGEALDSYRFHEAAHVVYHFFWGEYCDWYLELIKPRLMSKDREAARAAYANLISIFEGALRMLSPFMPFITEELWAVTSTRACLLALAPWPRKAAELMPEQAALMAAAASSPVEPLPAMGFLVVELTDFTDPAAEAEIGWVVDLVTAIRSVRAEMNIPPATLTALVLSGASAETKERAPRWSDVIKRMARLSDISFADRAPEGSVQLLVRGEVASLPLKGVIDLAAEKTRLDKELGKADADIKRVDTKLANEKFVANAPEEVVEEEKEKREAALARKNKILEALERLKSAAT